MRYAVMIPITDVLLRVWWTLTLSTQDPPIVQYVVAVLYSEFIVKTSWVFLGTVLFWWTHTVHYFNLVFFLQFPILHFLAVPISTVTGTTKNGDTFLFALLQ